METMLSGRGDSGGTGRCDVSGQRRPPRPGAAPVVTVPPQVGGSTACGSHPGSGLHGQGVQACPAPLWMLAQL